MSDEALILQPIHDGRTLEREGRPVLEFALCRPRLVEETRGRRRVQRYYDRLCRSWLERWTGPLYQRACQAEEAALASARPFVPWRASFAWHLTYAGETALSLSWEAVEVRGEIRRVCRGDDVWSLRDGRPLALADALPPGRGRWTRARREVARQLEALEAAAPGEVHPRWRANLPRCLRAGRFSLTAEGPVLLAPPGTLRPARAGWCSFPLTGQTAPGL